MKQFLILFALACCHLATAQVEVVEKSYPFNGQELDIDVDLGTEINVQSWNKNEISIKITYEVNDGDDNDAVTVDLDDYTGRLALDISLNERKLRNSDHCCCNGDKNTYWNGDSRKKNCIEMLVEVKIPANADVRVKTVIGDVIIEGMNSNIEVESVTGLIDIDWDESMGAEVSLKTTTGDLYTNIDLDRKKDRGLALISSHNVEGRLKGGEKEIYLKTVTSDIYFRKSGK